MTVDEFVGKAFEDHADHAEAVFARLPEGIALVSEPRHHPQVAHLVAHVSGEHLGRWGDGIRLLETMEARPGFDPATVEGKAVLRQKAFLHRCAGDPDGEVRWTRAAHVEKFPEASNRIRVLALAAQALAFQRRPREARLDLEEALRLAAYGPKADDPAARALAAAANNIAQTLEGRTGRTPEENALMVRAAEAALTWWRVAGSWREETTAEYRLTFSLLQAGLAGDALVHAQRSLEIVDANGGAASAPGEAFNAHDALARARHGCGDAQGARRERDAAAALLPKIDGEVRGFFAQDLERLDEVLQP
jgi:hypothetical protein